MTQATATGSVFGLRPRPGDIWRFKTPRMSRWRTKRVGHISRVRITRDRNGELIRNLLVPYVNWYRLPRGRRTGISIKQLLTYGELAWRDSEDLVTQECLREHLRLRRYWKGGK